MPTEQTTPTVPAQATVTPIRRVAGGATAREQIPGMRDGWLFDPATREILHQAGRTAEPLPVGTVPPVLGRVTYRQADRGHTRLGFQLLSPEGQKRIAQTSQIHDGSWADLLGVDRPVGAEERQAFAKVMSTEVRSAPELPAIAVKATDGTITLPDAESQDLGYLRLGDPDETAARRAWERVLRLAMDADRTSLALGAFFAGPLVSSLQSVPTHVLNLYGGGQAGKSSAQKVQAAMVGDPSASYKVFGPLSTTANALPEWLLLARYLPMAREEVSAGGLSLRELRALISRILSGGRRDRLGQDGTAKVQVGEFHSVACFSSNESLLTPGQPESFASRVVELFAPFFGGADQSDEAVALSAQYHGWPLHWAKQDGAFDGAKVKEWRDLHTAITARLSTAEGGIPRTLARVLAAWCVGAHLLAQVLGMPEFAERAFEDARTELPRVVADAHENNQSYGAVLWEQLAGLVATEPLCWPDYRQLGPGASPDDAPPVRSLLGYWYDGKDGLEVHVLKTTMDALGKQAGIETTIPGLSEMRRLGVLRSTQGATKLTSKPPGAHLRKAVPGMVYIINVDRARECYNEAPTLGDVVPPTLAALPDDSPITRAERAAAQARAALAAREATTAGAGVAEPVAVAVATAVAVEHGPVQAVPAVVEPPARQPLVFPPAVASAEIDKSWEALVKAGGRAASTAAVGALDKAGLHLPNREVVELERLPQDVDETYALMEAYGLRTLYLHLSAAEAMGLPEYRVSDHYGPMKPTPHPWATPAPDGPVAEVQPGGVSAWMTLVPADGSPRRHVAVPGFDPRFDKRGQRHGFGGAPDGAVLLDAVMLFIQSTAKGRKPQPIGYYRSPNRTAEAYAGGREREGITSEAVRRRAIPPLARSPRLQPMVDGGWKRDLLPAEREMTHLHKYDKSAAWLAAFGSTPLGVGEPEHLPHGGIRFDRRFAGIWRVADIPDLSQLWYLPELRPTPAEEGGWWLRSTPALALLADAYPGWTPEIAEAWIWPNSSRVLESGFYTAVRTGREFIIRQGEAGRPGAPYAKAVNGKLYKSFRGYLERGDDLIQRDRTTGEIYAKDIWWRPDWAQHLMDAAMGNTWRNLSEFTASGHYPISLQVDAVIYASDQADPTLAKPTAMKLGEGGGEWTLEGSAPLQPLLPAIERNGVWRAMYQHINGLTEEGTR